MTYQHIYTRTSILDLEEQIDLPGMVELMQKASYEHAIRLKASYIDFKSFSWVLLSKEVFIYQYPSPGSTVETETYPTGFDRFFARRDFRVLCDGRLIAEACSLWTLIDLASRKVISVPEWVREMKIGIKKVPFLAARKMVTPKEWEYQSTLDVNKEHLDWNDHVNNLIYVDAIFKGYGRNIKHDLPIHIHLVYKGEARIGDKINISTDADKRGFHRLSNEATGKTLMVSKMDYPQGENQAE